MYDVIVIGAGPAGCMAAKRIAEAGYRVLLVERMQVPRDKSCSGVLIEKSINLVEREFGIIPEAVKCTPKTTRGIIITNENNQEFRFESRGMNIWRSLFDSWLASLAEEAGAEVRPSTTALVCEESDDHVVVRLKQEMPYSEKAKVVVVCDGAGGVIKRKTLNAKNRYIITYQAFCRGTIDLENDFFYAFLQPEFSEHDAWFNVKDDFLIFGVCVNEADNIKRYYSRFLEFLKVQYNAKVEPTGKEERWLLPYIEPEYPINAGRGRILFAGEAANFLNPMGEGISGALVSGYAAAEAIRSVCTNDKVIDEQALLNLYDNNLQEEKQYLARQWGLLAEISPKFSRYSGIIG